MTLLALAGLLACNGDDTASGSDTASSTVGTESESGSTTATGSASNSASATVTVSGSDSETATMGSVSVSATDSTTMGTGTTVSTSMSSTATDTEGTTGVSVTETDTGNCDPDKTCGDECCAPDQVCSEGACHKDCGGDDPCGPQEECCGPGQICYLDACIDPGPACSQVTCATQVSMDECDEGYICDPNLGLCVPTQADLNCQYVPDVGVFDASPQFTWGQRKKIACQMDSQCQKAEICQGGFCAVTWSHITPANDDMPTHYQVSSIPLVTDLDQDCIPEIVFNTYTGTTITANGVLRAIRGDTGDKVWTVTDPAYRTDSTSNVAVGDIDSDGQAEVVACGESKYLIAIETDGTPKWKSDAFTGPKSSGSVAIANIDNDGDPEIVFGAAVYDSKGKLLYEGKNGAGANGQGPISCIADLDNDGRPEVIGGKAAYTFTGLVSQGDFAGAVMWVSPAPSDGFCGIADLDKDGNPDVVLVANTQIYVLNGQTGAIRAQYAIPNGGRGGPPNIADFDGDTFPDIAAAGSSRFIVLQFDGKMNKLTPLWTAVTQDGSSQVTGSSVFDFDGDGRNEVVYNDEVYIRIYPGVEPDCQKNPKGPACDGNMTDAEVLLRDKNSSRTRTEYPVIADVDGDFKAEIVFSTNNDSGFSVDAGIEVWGDRLDNWVSTRPVWNQHTYHVTNVGLVGDIPGTEPNNWEYPMQKPYNSYRRNAQGTADFCAPDLVPYDLDAEFDICPKISICVWVANQGCLGVGAGVEVSFYEQSLGLLGTVLTKGPIVAGGAEQVCIMPDVEMANGLIWATVDDDGMMMGALNECKEDNNTTEMIPLCLAPK
ncbi:MAG: FG-GAP-like repeat-containing protein [Nannocystaceae bacterium]